MISIITDNVQGRADWYHARAYVGERYYGAFMSTRIGALLEVLKQLHTRGITF